MPTDPQIIIRPYAPSDQMAWDTYVATHPESTVFHRAAWKTIIEQSMGYPGTYLMAWQQDRPVGLYPFFILKTGLFGTLGVSLPYLGYGGMLADDAAVEQALADRAAAIGREAGCDYIEMRQRVPLKNEWPVTDRKVGSTIPVADGADRVFERLHRNVRNKIRKAENHGVTVDQGPEYLPEFYDIYARNLRDLGTPVLTRRFFEVIVDALPERVNIYRAIRQGKTIAAKMVLLDRDTCYFVWSASIRDALCHAPVHAMNWHAIEEACRSGCRSIDLGRSTADSSHQEFKKYWGSETQILPWAYQLLRGDRMPGLNKENRKFLLAIRLWKHLPLRVSRWLGPPLARRLP